LGCGEKFTVEMKPQLTRVESGGTDNPS